MTSWLTAGVVAFNWVCMECSEYNVSKVPWDDFEFPKFASPGMSLFRNIIPFSNAVNSQYWSSVDMVELLHIVQDTNFGDHPRKQLRGGCALERGGVQKMQVIRV